MSNLLHKRKLTITDGLQEAALDRDGDIQPQTLMFQRIFCLMNQFPNQTLSKVQLPISHVHYLLDYSEKRLCTYPPLQDGHRVVTTTTTIQLTSEKNKFRSIGVTNVKICEQVPEAV